MINPTAPNYLSGIRTLTAEGIGLGRLGEQVAPEEAAQSLQEHGFVDVHVGSRVEERLNLKQVSQIQAIHNGDTSPLSETIQALLRDMRTVEGHQGRFVSYSGQANTISGFGIGGGEYHAYTQTTIPLSLALADIDAGFPYQSGVFGYQPAIGVATPVEPDGDVDKYVQHAWLTKEDVGHIADDYRIQDRLRHS